MGLGWSIGLLLTSPHRGVCSASITTAVSTAGRIIAEWSERGGSQVSQLSARCQRKTHWSLKVMKRLPQRPSVLLGSLPASTLNRSTNGDDPCMPASHARIHIVSLFFLFFSLYVCLKDKFLLLGFSDGDKSVSVQSKKKKSLFAIKLNLTWGCLILVMQGEKDAFLIQASICLTRC